MSKRRTLINGGEVEYKLSPEDLEFIKDDIETDLTIKWYNDYKNKQFTTGDVLIASTVEKSWKGVIKATPIKYSYSEVRKRYLVIHSDPATQSVWIKDIELDGSVREQDDPEIMLTAMSTYDEEYTSYEVDPLSVEATLLGHDYDVKSVLVEERNRRDVIIKTNKINGTVINTLKKANAVVRLMTEGDTYYYRDKKEVDTDNFRTVQIQSKRKVNWEHFKSVRSGRRYAGKSENTYNCDHVYYIKCAGGIKFKSVDLVGKVIYYNKPELLVPINETI